MCDGEASTVDTVEWTHKPLEHVPEGIIERWIGWRYADRQVRQQVWQDPGGGARSVGWAIPLAPWGTVRVAGDGAVSVGGSLVRLAREVCDWDPHEGNRILLAPDRVAAGWQAAQAEAQSLAGWEVGPAHVRRVDICYQRRIEGGLAALGEVPDLLRRGGTVATYSKGARALGWVLEGGVRRHRCYDKGLESGDQGLIGMIRSEEQVRRKAAAFSGLWEGGNVTVSETAAEAVINEHYPEPVHSRDLSAILSTRGGEAAVLYALCPGQREAMMERRGRSAQYALRGRAAEVAAIPLREIDLRVPPGGFWDVAQ